MSEKIAPVQGYSAGIPWSMHLRAYDAYSKKWSPQPAMIDLEGRNCRGGFSTGELDDFIPGWRDELSEIAKLKAEIEKLRADCEVFIASNGALTSEVLALRADLASIRSVYDFASLEAKIAELRAALKPFAEIGLWRDHYPDAKHDELTSQQMRGFVQVEHVRAARAALASEQKEGKTND